jgi:hypothetical protein
MEKTGDIYLSDEKGHCVAYWRPADGSSHVALCTMKLSICNDHPHVRDLFVELATEIALNRTRTSTPSGCNYSRR